MDIAARGDLTVIAVLEATGGRLWCRELVEMRGAPFAEQLAALDRVMRDYRVVRCAMDQTGMGEMPVEEARRRHGQYRIEGVLLTASRKLDLATCLKEAMEDRRLAIPPSRDLRADLHAVQRVPGATGAPRLVAERGPSGHADRFWAVALAVSAAAQPAAPIEFASAGKRAIPDGTRLEVDPSGFGGIRGHNDFEGY